MKNILQLPRRQYEGEIRYSVNPLPKTWVLETMLAVRDNNMTEVGRIPSHSVPPGKICIHQKISSTVTFIPCQRNFLRDLCNSWPHQLCPVDLVVMINQPPISSGVRLKHDPGNELFLWRMKE